MNKRAHFYAACVFIILMLQGCGNVSPNVPAEKVIKPDAAQSAPTKSAIPLKMPETTSTATIPQTVSFPEEDPKISVSKPAAVQPKKKQAISKYFETRVYDRQAGRMKNLKLASKKVNGFKLNPGDVFSFNGVVGRRTESKGYKEGIVFIKGEKVKKIGGGICQLSTTLYIAAKGSGLEIIERHEHDLDVPYAKRGTDATVAYNYLDLKFKNTLDVPITIKCSVDKKKVAVSINYTA